MNLQNFIKETLLQIQRGIRDAQGEFHTVETDRGVICPHFNAINALEKSDAQLVEFDVAVTVTESTERGGDGKLNVAMVSLGGKKQHLSETESVSRIKFAIPIIPPKTIVHLSR